MLVHASADTAYIVAHKLGGRRSHGAHLNQQVPQQILVLLVLGHLGQRIPSFLDDGSHRVLTGLQHFQAGCVQLLRVLAVRIP
jgi:hypothetical protein